MINSEHFFLLFLVISTISTTQITPTTTSTTTTTITSATITTITTCLSMTTTKYSTTTATESGNGKFHLYFILPLPSLFIWISDADALLITGGFGTDLDAFGNDTAELYLPSSGLSCSLPRLPDYRATHTQESSGLLCGGYNTADTCIQWSPDTGTWEEYLSLDNRRDGHVSWTPGTGTGTYLMGGIYNKGRRTTTLIRPDGTQETGFSLKYDAL